MDEKDKWEIWNDRLYRFEELGWRTIERANPLFRIAGGLVGTVLGGAVGEMLSPEGSSFDTRFFNIVIELGGIGVGAAVGYKIGEIIWDKDKTRSQTESSQTKE